MAIYRDAGDAGSIPASRHRSVIDKGSNMPGTTSRPFVKCGSFKGKGAKANAQQAARELSSETGHQWEAAPLGSKKQKGNSYAIQRVS
jgi:hypothetical protein